MSCPHGQPSWKECSLCRGMLGPKARQQDFLQAGNLRANSLSNLRSLNRLNNLLERERVEQLRQMRGKEG